MRSLPRLGGRADTPFIPAQTLNEAKTKRLPRKYWSPVSSRSSVWVRIRPREKNGPMMITPQPRRKHRLSNGVVPVLGSVGIFITSPEPGLTWTTASDQRQFRNWLDGRHRRVGKKAFGPVVRVRGSHQNEQWPEMAAMASTTAVRVLTGTASSTRSNGWNTWYANVCI